MSVPSISLRIRQTSYQGHSKHFNPIPTQPIPDLPSPGQQFFNKHFACCNHLSQGGAPLPPPLHLPSLACQPFSPHLSQSPIRNFKGASVAREDNQEFRDYRHSVYLYIGNVSSHPCILCTFFVIYVSSLNVLLT